MSGIEIIMTTDLAETRHARDFLALMQVYATDEMGGGRALPDDVIARLVPSIRARPGVDVLLAYHGEECVGLMTLIEGFSTFHAAPLLNIHDMVVTPRYRRRGLSHQLLKRAEAEARRRGCVKLTLEVLSGNEAAQASYRSFGFAGYQLDPSKGEALFWQKSLA